MVRLWYVQCSVDDRRTDAFLVSKKILFGPYSLVNRPLPDSVATLCLPRPPGSPAPSSTAWSGWLCGPSFHPFLAPQTQFLTGTPPPPALEGTPTISQLLPNSARSCPTFFFRDYRLFGAFLFTSSFFLSFNNFLPLV